MVFAIASGAVRVVERLQHLRAQHVVAAGDVEACALVELFLIFGHLARIPAKAVRANAGQSLVVGVLAAGDELKAKVDVLLLLKDEAAENEVSAIEAGKVAGIKFERSVVESGQVGKIWAGRRVGSEMLDCAVGRKDPAVIGG